MKNLFRILLCVAFVGSAIAADTDAVMSLPGSANKILTGGTNKLVAFSTNGPYYFSATEQTDLTIYLTVKYLNAVGSGDTNGIRLDVYPGISDAGTIVYGEDLFLQRSFQANATTTTAKLTVTNQPVASITHFKAYLVNGSTNAHVTNLVFWVKPKTVAAKQR
jgi:hypothetical protein